MAGAGKPRHPAPAALAGDPAYLFFNSGTTGVPKGILGLHKGVAHFVAWQRERFEIGPQDRVAQLTALSFDALLREIFLPLSSGGALHIPDAEELADPARLVGWLSRAEITLLHTVPSKARNWLVAAGRKTPLPTLRRVFFSGEPLTRSLVDDWRAVFGSEATLVNLYGSTETTMTKCYRVVEPAGEQAAPLSAVQAMSDTQALVMSGNRLCGIGEPGEIVIRTPFRTAGYLDGGEAAAFRENPARKGDLIYRSGDQGRFRPDGSVEVLGRLDDQVKVRGMRVEPAEVKSLIDTHPEIANSAVIARVLEADHELIAYIVPGSNAGGMLVERLREFLAATLPFALLPRCIVSLDTLPLLPNGKVDRKALPEPARAVDRVVVAPRNETETRLLAVWREVLAAPARAVGVEDNFFELGGNSLGATRVTSRIRTEFGLELPLKTLFTHPTVAALARHLDFLDAASGVLAEDEDADAWEMVETL
jgi:acyl-coenzyme A synthetase/AMP-(fatty) acid ligase/acyl carrier protein